MFNNNRDSDTKNSLKDNKNNILGFSKTKQACVIDVSSMSDPGLSRLIQNMLALQSFKPTEWSTGVTGLRLAIGQKSASWRFQYRDNLGRSRKRSLGRIDEVSIADAIALASKVQQFCKANFDPADFILSKRKRTLNCTELSLKYFDYLDSRVNEQNINAHKIRDISAREFKRDLKNHFLPRFGNMLPRHVTKDMISSLLKTAINLRTKSALSQNGRRRIWASVSGFFTWASEHIDEHPARGMRLRPGKPRHHKVKYEDLRHFWNLVEKGFVDIGENRIDLNQDARIMLKLEMLLPRRPREITSARKDEFDFESGRWIIGAERHKNSEPLAVPLPPLTLTLFREAYALSGDSQYLFPKAKKKIGKDLPVSRTYINHQFDKLKPAFPVPFQIRDLRRTIATECGAFNARDEDIDELLGHKSTRISRKHYNLHKDSERIGDLLGKWEEKLLAVVYSGM